MVDGDGRLATARADEPGDESGDEATAQGQLRAELSVV